MENKNNRVIIFDTTLRDGERHRGGGDQDDDSGQLKAYRVTCFAEVSHGRPTWVNQ